MLELEGVSARHGKLAALRDVSLQVPEGQLVSLVGANGAGKSTLVRVIAGLHRPTAGAVRFRGEAITRLPPHEIVRRGLVLVPEGRRLFPEMTVRENLWVGGSAPGARADREQAYRRVVEIFPRLHEKDTQLARTLSGGEQQMLALGRALMSSPRLLILDEPSLGLAPRLVRHIFQVVTDLKTRGLTILLIEQNVRRSLALCDHGYVLEHGAVVLHGTGAALLADERTRRAYLGT